MLAFVVVWSMAGCISAHGNVERLSHNAGRGAVEGAATALPELSDPLRKTVRTTLLNDDTLQQAAQRLTQATVQSLRNGLSATDTQQSIEELVSHAAGTVGREGSEAIRQLIQSAEPELKQALRGALASGSIALRDSLERDLAPTIRNLAKANADIVVGTLTTGLKAELSQIREAARRTGSELITEAANSMRDNKEVVGRFSHRVVAQALRRPASTMRADLRVSLIAALAVFSLLLVLSAAGLAVCWRRYDQSVKSIATIAESINQHEAAALKAAIAQSARGPYGAGLLSNVFKRYGL
jgi:glutamyl-tRNA reductase